MYGDLKVRAVLESDKIVQKTGYRRAQERAQRERRWPDARQQTEGVYVVWKTGITGNGKRTDL